MSHYAANDLAIDPRGKIRLRAIFDAKTAEHLRGVQQPNGWSTPLSTKQTWRRIPGTDLPVEIRATVTMTMCSSSASLLSLGSEVAGDVEPAPHLRREMAEELGTARQAYGD